PNVGDSPRETVVNVPLDPRPARPVGLFELEPKWPLGVRHRSLRRRDNGPGNRRDRHCNQQQRLHLRFLSAKIRVADTGAFTDAPVGRVEGCEGGKAPIGNSPSEQDFTSPTHSMPITVAASAHSLRRMCKFGMVVPNALFWTTTCPASGSGSGISLQTR